MNTTQSWRVSNQIHKFIFSLSHFVVSPNDLCLSFLTWNLEISDFQYHPQIRLLTKSLKHINKTELFFFFRKMPIILEKIKCDVMYLGSVFFFFFGPTPQDQHHMVHGLLSFFLALREDIFLDSDNSLPTVLIADIPNFYAQDPLLVHKGAAGG